MYVVWEFSVEIYQTINTLNPEFVNSNFKVKENKKLVREQYKLNLETTEWNQFTVGAKNLEVHGPEIWNSLPFYNKSSENLNILKFQWKIELTGCAAGEQFAQNKVFIRSIFY